MNSEHIHKTIKWLVGWLIWRSHELEQSWIQSRKKKKRKIITFLNIFYLQASFVLLNAWCSIIKNFRMTFNQNVVWRIEFCYFIFKANTVEQCVCEIVYVCNYSKSFRWTNKAKYLSTHFRRKRTRIVWLA